MANWAFPTAQTFLCCFSLQNGVKLYGWIFLVGHMMFSMEGPFRSIYYYLNCHFYVDEVTGSRECPDWMYNELLVIAIVEVTLVLLQITTSFLLLLGVYQKTTQFVYQWIILQLSMLAFDVVFTYFTKYFFSLQDDTHSYLSIIFFLWKCAEMYGIYIVFSYYKRMSPNPEMIV